MATARPAQTTTGPAASGNTNGRPAQRPVLDWTIDRIMAVLAAVMLPVGTVLVLLGWWGAAHTPFVFEQIPYMISGGLLGVGLLTAGGLLYVGSWLSKLADVHREEGDKTRDMLSGLRDDLRMLPHAMGGSAADGNGSAPSMFASQPALVATRTGTMYHLEDCSVVAGRSDLRSVTGDESGLRPCKLCQPDSEPALSH